MAEPEAHAEHCERRVSLLFIDCKETDMLFFNAIVRTPCRAMIYGLTSVNLGRPDYHKALDQHAAYIDALERCGLQVTVLPPDEAYPDSCFVEDIVLCTSKGAILTCPGAESRRGEVASIREVISQFYNEVLSIEYPCTIDAGDIITVAKHFYIGLSARTNASGAHEMISKLNSLGLTGETVEIEGILHLKTGAAYLENNNLLLAETLQHKECFQRFNRISVSSNEVYAANSIWVNGRVIMPAGYPKTLQKIQDLGYEVIDVDTSEFEKLDGGVSCLSLRI